MDTVISVRGETIHATFASASNSMMLVQHHPLPPVNSALCIYKNPCIYRLDLGFIVNTKYVFEEFFKRSSS